jgi:hypothetical protein
VKNREREAAPSPAGSVKTVANASVSRKGSVERVDDRTEVIDNGDGTKTARIRVVPQSFAGEKGREAVDTELVESGGKLVSKATASPISVALSSGSADLVVVGKPGKQLRIGRPNGSGLTNGKANGKSYRHQAKPKHPIRAPVPPRLELTLKHQLLLRFRRRKENSHLRVNVQTVE